MPPDSVYEPGVVPDPDELYLRLGEELHFDPATGRIPEGAEMPVVDGKAHRTLGSTAFHPIEARQTQSQWHGVRPVPHRHAYFATSADIREPSQATVNRSLRNVEALQPVVPFADVPALDAIRHIVGIKTGLGADFFNFANANLYWRGDDSKLGDHEDQDHRLPVAEGPLTATVTLNQPGCTRPRLYQYTPHDTAHPILAVLLQSGSLNVLGRVANQRGKHGIPAQKRSCARLSLNFRHVPTAKRKREASEDRGAHRRFARLPPPPPGPIDLD